MVDDGRAYGDPRDNRSLDAAVGELAGRQHGVVSGAQLRELGFSKHAVHRRVERRRLLRVHSGVFAVGHLALTPDSRRMAAVLACGRGALLSHRAAGALHALLPSSPQFDVTVQGSARRPREGVVVHRSRSIQDQDKDSVRGIPVTSIARTLVDLADVVDEERLGRALREADYRRLLDLSAIERVLARVPGRAGAPRLAAVLAAYRPEPHFTRSEAERRFVELCARHGLPAPATNAWVAGHEVDALWTDVGVAVEIDGAAAHQTRAAFQRDRSRDRTLAAEGIQVVRVTWRDLADERALATQLAAIRQEWRRARSR